MTNAVGKLLNISRKLHEKKIPLLPRLVKNMIRVVFSCDIHYQAKIHSSVEFGHNGLGTIISVSAEIGKGTLIMHNTTIGRVNFKTKMSNGRRVVAPIIGENVYIGANAIIIGPVIIGDNAVIGAGSIVVNDVPRNGVVMSKSAELVKIKTDDEITSATIR